MSTIQLDAETTETTNTFTTIELAGIYGCSNQDMKATYTSYIRRLGISLSTLKLEEETNKGGVTVSLYKLSEQVARNMFSRSKQRNKMNKLLDHYLSKDEIQLDEVLLLREIMKTEKRLIELKEEYYNRSI